MQLSTSSFFLAPSASAAVSRPPAQPLPRGAILAVERPQGVVVHCRAGALWLTHDGDPKDVVIDAGESYTSRSGARLLVQALEASSVAMN